MSEDNILNLRNRVVTRLSGNDQGSSAVHTYDPPPTLPEIPETSGRSAPPESTLSELFGQMVRVMRALERRVQAQGTGLDSGSATVAAQLQGVLQPMAPLQTAQPPGAVQPQAAPFPAGYRPMSPNISHQQETSRGLLTSPYPSIHQSYAGGKRAWG